MTYTAAEGRQELLDSLGEAIDDIGLALACLGAAYEQLDQGTADALEEQLFGPTQRAYGQARRAHASFSARAGLAASTFEAQPAGLPSTGAKGFIDNSMAALGAADGRLATLQDAEMLVEVGDVELRKDLADLRTLIGGLPQRARELVRRLGR